MTVFSYLAGESRSDQIATYALDGIVRIQVRAARTSNTSTISIPAAHFDAIREVSEQLPSDEK